MWKIMERADALVLYKYIDELQFALEMIGVLPTFNG